MMAMVVIEGITSLILLILGLVILLGMLYFIMGLPKIIIFLLSLAFMLGSLVLEPLMIPALILLMIVKLFKQSLKHLYLKK